MSRVQVKWFRTQPYTGYESDGFVPSRRCEMALGPLLLYIVGAGIAAYAILGILLETTKTGGRE